MTATDSLFHAAAADLKDARTLLPLSPRAAGMLCGVAVERCLLGALRGNGLTPTGSVGAWADVLLHAGVLSPEQRRLVWQLVKLRGRCVHASPHTPTAEVIALMLSCTGRLHAELCDPMLVLL